MCCIIRYTWYVLLFFYNKNSSFAFWTFSLSRFKLKYVYACYIICTSDAVKLLSYMAKPTEPNIRNICEVKESLSWNTRNFCHLWVRRIYVGVKRIEFVFIMQYCDYMLRITIDFVDSKGCTCVIHNVLVYSLCNALNAYLSSAHTHLVGTRDVVLTALFAILHVTHHACAPPEYTINFGRCKFNGFCP